MSDDCLHLIAIKPTHYDDDGYPIRWLISAIPSNTLAAQTYMILFIILFIQFRPRGIIALKGRAAEA